MSAALWVCLWQLVGRPMAVVVPWASVAGVAAVCVGVTVVCAVVPTLFSRLTRRAE